MGMIELGEFALLRPLWLLALPFACAVPWLAAGSTGLSAWERAIDAPLMVALRRFGLVQQGRPRRPWPLALAMLALCLALAGPARQSTDAGAFRNLDGVVILVDISRSMTQSAEFPAAIRAARQAVDATAARPTALLVFAGDAYAVSPFSTDPETLGTTLSLLDGETAPDQGSCLQCGLDLAAAVLEKAAIVSSDVVLISDGASGASGEGLHFSVPGARLSALVPDAGAAAPGAPPPEPEALRRLAAATGGQVASLSAPGPVVDALAGRAGGTREAASAVSDLVWQDYGRVFAFLAALPLLLCFRRGGLQ